ncbi:MULTISPECIES: hypothetical protein [Streptomyces]|uniref:hypothetical protein n=1 Tax=Streptomyces TaxID=1883 RepID=UPI001319FFA7|nr:hypothetical protein [Streptomyces sp. CNS654]
MRRTMATLVAAGAVLGGLSFPVQAAEQQDAEPLSQSERKDKMEARLAKTDNKVVEASIKKERKQWTITAKEFNEARSAVRQARTKSLTESNNKKIQDFTRQAAEQGNTYRVDDVEVIPLLDGDVEAIIPKSTIIEHLTVDVADGAVTLEAETSNPGEALAEYGGPGMAADWVPDGSGQYILRVPGMGEGHFTWKRNKLAEDGSGTYDWYQYSRFGVAKPANINNYPDPYVKLIRVQSYPYDAIEPKLVTWEDIDPKTSFTGDCNATNLSLSVSAPVVGIGYNFNDCDEIEVWYNSSKPGSQWVEMDQGAVLWNGGRDYEIAYTHSFKVKQGTAGSMHDFQRVTFEDGFTDGQGSCDAYDGSMTC